MAKTHEDTGSLLCPVTSVKWKVWPALLKLTQQARSCTRLIRRAASRLALEGGEEVLAQLLWDVILQVCGHEELEALIINGLREDREKNKQVSRITEVLSWNEVHTNHRCTILLLHQWKKDMMDIWLRLIGPEMDLQWSAALIWGDMPVFISKSLMTTWFEAIKVETFSTDFTARL